MESRVKKYSPEGIETKTSSIHSTRSSRNAKLYKSLYSEYDSLDNLPIEDNTDEIDMNKLRELVSNNNSAKDYRQIKENLNVLEQRKRRIDEKKLYDINKILEKAKYENRKLKEPVGISTKPKRDLLSTLGSSELSLEEINAAKKRYQEQMSEKQENIKQDEFSITRELKYKNLEKADNEEEKDEFSNTNSLSLDLFEDLKATDNTIKTKPITSDISLNLLETSKINVSEVKSDIRSEDTSDIDIIKDATTTSSNDFFTNVYEFSKKDFADADDEDFFDTPKKSGLFKIVLLVLAIVIFVGVIIYFIGTYGLGIS